MQDFYEDIFLELAKYGEVEYLNVCDNLADHMVGNVYAKFRWALPLAVVAGSRLWQGGGRPGCACCHCKAAAAKLHDVERISSTVCMRAAATSSI